jgi:hypothetical protein
VISKATVVIHGFFHSSSQQWEVKYMIIEVYFRFDGSDRQHGRSGRGAKFELKIAVKI